MGKLINPATGELLREVADTPLDGVAAAVRRARAAFEEWSAATPAERARVMLRFADLVEDDAEELTRLEVAETGKPATVFRDGELPFAADNLRFFAGAARSLEGTGAGCSAPATPRCWSAARSASSGRSRRGTSPLSWPCGRWVPRSRRGTRWSSSPHRRRRAPRSGWPSCSPVPGRPRAWSRWFRRRGGGRGPGRRPGRRHGERHGLDRDRPRRDARGRRRR